MSDNRLHALQGLVLYDPTDGEARLHELHTQVLYRPNDGTTRLHAVQVLVLFRETRTWGDIPGAGYIWDVVPIGGTGEVFLFRRTFTVGAGYISTGQLQLVADYAATVYINGALVGTYTAEAEEAPIQTLDVDRAWLRNGTNVLGIRVATEADARGILEYRLVVV